MVQGSGAAVYLMENGNRRLIPDPETFNTMRLDWNTIQHITDGDLNNIPEGSPLPAVSSIPPLHSNASPSNPLRGFSHPLGLGEQTPISWTHWSGYGQQYAVDFGAGFGTPVYAMRSGTVVDWRDTTLDRDPKLSSIATALAVKSLCEAQLPLHPSDS
jgi:murein DD-endopeptidase MepM/ murein hydrolase activator NlpD